MSTIFWLPSSGAADVSPTPSSADWTLHINTVSRPMTLTRGNTALTTLAYNPDAADHLVDGNTMVAQFVSEILPPQTIPAQQIAFGARFLEAAASNNLVPAWKLYAVNVAGTSVLATLLAFAREATEMATALTGAGRIRASSAVTLNEPFRLVFEVGGGGLPTNSATDTHNMSIAFGDPLATGDLTLVQQGDTGACPTMLIFSTELRTLPAGAAVYAAGLGG